MISVVIAGIVFEMRTVATPNQLDPDNMYFRSGRSALDEEGSHADEDVGAFVIDRARPACLKVSAEKYDKTTARNGYTVSVDNECQTEATITDFRFAEPGDQIPRPITSLQPFHLSAPDIDLRSQVQPARKDCTKQAVSGDACNMFEIAKGSRLTFTLPDTDWRAALQGKMSGSDEKADILTLVYFAYK